MQLALDLAAEAAGRTCPNPPVGAVIVRDNAIVGRYILDPVNTYGITVDCKQRIWT